MKYKFLNYKAHEGKLTYRKVKEMEEKYSLPLYIYDENGAVANADEIKKYLGINVRLCYSAKANYYFAKALSESVEMIEVCTGGELRYCLEQGIPAEKLVYNGVWKSEKDMEYAVKSGVGRIVLDSREQLLDLQCVVESTIKVMLRLSSGNQFGMRVDEIEQIVKEQNVYKGLEITGVHYYAGTQRSCMRQIQRDLEEFMRQLRYLKDRKVNFEEIQIGGGIGVPLYRNDRNEEFEVTADYLFDFIKKLSADYNVTYECGRAIAANAGKYITQVFNKKHRENKEILLVRGGSNHLSYYGNIVGQKQPFIESITRKKGEEEREYMICGSLCSANDILSMVYTDYGIEVGDYMIFYNAGAYSLQEASTLFLTMEMPRVLIYNMSMRDLRLLELGWTCSEYRTV